MLDPCPTDVKAGCEELVETRAGVFVCNCDRSLENLGHSRGQYYIHAGFGGGGSYNPGFPRGRNGIQARRCIEPQFFDGKACLSSSFLFVQGFVLPKSPNKLITHCLMPHRKSSFIPITGAIQPRTVRSPGVPCPKTSFTIRRWYGHFRSDW